MLCHSPLNYSAWNITFPHAEALRELKIDQMIAQVWTGTARSAIRHAGISAERTFENAWLEYSSSLELVRGLDIPTWLLMDPVEDNGERSMEDYFINYKRTLGAALMFPQTDLYEVMPWPTRIFGRVPDDFATVICNVIAALSDMQNHPDARHDRGTEGIATFLADSAMWQRNDPARSDFDAVYGLCLPMLMRGVPAEIAHLDRVADAGYLDPHKVLLVSFDAIKPERKEIVDALVDWTRKGGQLLVFGGDDAYNGLDMWWQQEGCASPHEYLLRQCGLDPSGMAHLGPRETGGRFAVADQTDYTGHDLDNQGTVGIDLSEACSETGSAFVKLDDTVKTDGWGPWIGGIRLIGTRDGKPVDETIKPGGPQEAALIYSDTGTGFDGTARFVDGSNELVYLLRFDPGTDAAVEFELGNQWRVSVATAPATAGAAAQAAPGSALGASLPLPGPAELSRALAYRNLGGKPALTAEAGTLVAQAAVGKGNVTVCGLSPVVFARTPQGDAFVRALVADACKSAGLQYSEQGHMGIQRGPYVAVKRLETASAADGPTMIDEPMVDLFSAELAIRPPGPLANDELAVLKHLPACDGTAPVLVHTSDCVEWQATANGELRLVVSGAEGVRGAMRVATSGKALTATATDANGKAAKVTVDQQGDTALLRYASQTQGLGLKLGLR
jgi:hypothetical protein